MIKSRLLFNVSVAQLLFLIHIQYLIYSSLNFVSSVRLQCTVISYFVDLLISDPLFDGERSHMVLSAISIRSETSIIIEMKPESLTGLVFYAALRMSAEYTGDFISISLYNGIVQLRLSLGSPSPLILTSNSVISTGMLYCLMMAYALGIAVSEICLHEICIEQL